MLIRLLPPKALPRLESIPDDISPRRGEHDPDDPAPLQAEQVFWKPLSEGEIMKPQ